MEHKEKSGSVDMTFFVPEEWHNEFKSSANQMGLSNEELLENAFECWCREHIASYKAEV